MGIFLVNPYLYFVKPWAYGGETRGYIAGGFSPSPTTRVATIRRFSLTADTSDTSVGSMPLARSSGAGQHSDAHGYISGGVTPPSTSGVTDVSKLPFATNVNSTSALSLSQGRNVATGASSETHGYTMGGALTTPPNSVVIDRFPFATNTPAINIGSLAEVKIGAAGHVSPTTAYISGGRRNPPVPTYFTSTVQSFPFATNVNATAVLNLVSAVTDMAGHSSETHGYAVGGSRSAAPTLANAALAQKFPFATNVNASSYTVLNTGLTASAAASSMTHGYVAGGVQSPTAATSTSRQKYPFATNALATNLPALGAAREQAAGLHV